MIIRHGITIGSGPVAALTALGDLVSVSGADVFYTVTGQGGGIQAWDIATLALLDSYDFDPAFGLDAPRGLVPVFSGADLTLLAPGTAGPWLEGVRLAPDGGLAEGITRALPGDVGGQALSALAVLQDGGQEVLIGASRVAGGLHVWRGPVDGPLTAVEQSLLQGILPNTVPVLLPFGSDQLLALVQGEAALMRLQVQSDGSVRLLDRADATDGLWIHTPTHLHLAEVAGETFALIGAAGSSSISVIALEPGGGLQVTDHVVDQQDTRFAGVTVLETVRIGAQTFVVAGGTDDGLSVMTLLPGGRLLRLGDQIDDAEMALSDPAALALRAGSDGFDIILAGGLPDPEPGDSGLGLTRLDVDLGLVGDVLIGGPEADLLTGGAGRDQITGGAGADWLSGQGGDDILMDGAGADTLTGGAGRDTFVLVADDQRDVIADFELGLDRLDLSQLGRFYEVAALDIRPTGLGAEIWFGNDVVEIRSALGTALTPEDFGIADLRDLWHLPVTPLPAAAADQQIIGTADADVLEGGAGNDSLSGEGGADLLIGQGGDDRVVGDLTDARFDPVAGQIFRLYQATLDRFPDAEGLLGWADVLLEGSQDLTQVASGFVQSREFQQVYGALEDAAFVTLLYLNVLDRPPDAAGLAEWSDRLASGALRREQVVLGFSESPEFIAATATQVPLVSRGGLQAAWSEEVFLLYQATLGRAPDLAGFLDWTGQLAGGMPFATVVAGFTGSPEFRQTYGGLDDAGFVTLLYANVLDRAPDAAGFASWLERLSSSALSREEVVIGFSQSPEFRADMAAALVDWMQAQGVDDTLQGGAGVNLLQGGVLCDRFVFRAADRGDHVVVDPEPWDVFAFEGFGYTDRADLMTHMRQSGTDVVFADQQVSVTLQGLTLADMGWLLLDF